MSSDPHIALADALRSLLDTTVRMRADDDALLDETAERVRALDARLRAHIPDPPPPRYAFTETPAFDELFAYDFVMGPRNPVAVPLRFTEGGNQAIAFATFGTVYEGPPNCVHGAVISAAFDQVLNIANLINGTPGPTVHLAMDFRKATPLNREIRFEASCDKVENRRIHSTARCYDGDTLTVEATGVFAQIDAERLKALLK